MAGGVVCCPFGPLSAAPIVVAIISFILSMVGSFACTFWVYNVAGSTQGFGLWTVEQVCIGSGCTYTCVNYSNLASFDAAWQAGRAFSMIAAIFAIVLLVIACTFACLPWPPKMFKITGLLAIWTGVCQIISLCGLGSESCLGGPNSGICTIGSSGIVAIVAAILWWITAAMFFIYPNKVAQEEVNDLPPVGAAVAAPAGQTTVEKTVETTENPDGTTTKVIKTTTTNPDGSKTVTETREE